MTGHYCEDVKVGDSQSWGFTPTEGILGEGFAGGTVNERGAYPRGRV